MRAALPAVGTSVSCATARCEFGGRSWNWTIVTTGDQNRERSGSVGQPNE